MSTEPCPIKVVDTAHSKNLRADEFVIETAKTGKVSAVVALMSIFSKKDAIHGAINPGMRNLLVKRRKVLISRRKFSTDQEAFLWKREKDGYQRN